MALIQKNLLDFIDIPCAVIIGIDGECRDPPICLTKDDLDNLFWKNRDEWDTITLHFLDGLGRPHPDGPVEFDRAEIDNSNHFLI